MIFEGMKRLIHKKKPTFTPEQYRTLSTLHDWMCNHSLVLVKIPQDGSTYQSMVLKVDTEEGVFFIDDLFPHFDGLALDPARKIQISMRDKQKTLSLTCFCMAREQNEGLYYYKMSLPKRVQSLQRRAAFRTEVPHHVGNSAQITLFQDILPQTLDCKIKDISVGGVAFLLDGDCRKLVEGEESFNAQINLKDISCMNVDVTVKHVRYNPDRDETIVGCQYLSLDPAEQSRLGRKLLDIQRRQARDYQVVQAA